MSRWLLWFFYGLLTIGVLLELVSFAAGGMPHGNRTWFTIGLVLVIVGWAGRTMLRLRQR
jgi:hypothetical protein